MSQLRHNRLTENRLGKVCRAMAMLLCLCIVVHMLGVPVTLLNPGGAADALATSADEGYSVPSSLPQPTPSFAMVPVTDAQPFVHMPVLASTLFHPPVH